MPDISPYIQQSKQPSQYIDCNLINLLPTNVITIRNQIETKVLSYIKNDDGTILLIITTQGTGKSTTTVKTLCLNNIRFGYLGYNSHNFIKNLINNKELKQYNIKHIYGMSYFCIHNDLIKFLVKRNMGIGDDFCKKCSNNSECGYLQQFTDLKDSGASFATVNSFMTHKLIQDGNYDVLLVDENPLSAFIKNPVAFNLRNIKTFKRVIELMYLDEKGSTLLDNALFYFTLVCDSLIVLLNSLPPDGRETDTYTMGKPLIDIFMRSIKKTDILYKFYDLLVPMGKKNNFTLFNVFCSSYNKVVKKVINDDEYIHFKNMVYEIKKLIEVVYEYHNSKHDINIPIRVIQRKKKPTTIEFSNLCDTLPDVPTIILDATGTKKMYEDALGIKVDEFNPHIDIDYNITQLMDGMYPLSSLTCDRTRENAFNTCYHTIMMWNGEGYIPFITTHRRFARIIEETDDEEGNAGLSFEEYLNNKGLNIGIINEKGEVIKTGCCYIKYFEEMIGVNFDNVIKSYVLGTPWLNDDDAKFMFGLFYEGEKALSSARGKDGITYLDERFGRHMTVFRERKAEQIVERARFIFPDTDKEVVFDSGIPIRFPTRKISRRDYLIELGVIVVPDVNIKCLKWIKEKDSVSFEDFYNKFVHTKGVKQVGGVAVIRDRLIKYGFVKVYKVKTLSKPKKLLHVTEKGLEYLTEK